MSDSLAVAALVARMHAHAPYSNFLVGAALEDETGRVHTGCNVENATYGLTLCAERVAVFKAMSEGARNSGASPLRPIPKPHASVRRLPPDPVGVLRRYRSDSGESQREDGDAAHERSVPEGV